MCRTHYKYIAFEHVHIMNEAWNSDPYSEKTWASLPICIIPHRNQGLLVRKLNSPNNIRCTFSAWTSGSIHAINFALFMSDIKKGIYERKKLMLRIFIITKLFFFLCVLFFLKIKQIFSRIISFQGIKNPDIYYFWVNSAWLCTHVYGYLIRPWSDIKRVFRSNYI